MWITLFILLIISGCSFSQQVKTEEGVSLELATLRKRSIDSVVYDLSFKIPLEEQLYGDIPSSVNISFNLDKEYLKQDLQIDFKAVGNAVSRVVVNGVDMPQCCPIVKEHIIVPYESLSDGDNSVFVEFKAGRQTLNINDDFLYTLLVPARARELFPCFDQPDLKASFNLFLEVDSRWEALSNSEVEQVIETGEQYKIIEFLPTEPLSTYLFAFAAGRFKKSVHFEGERSVTIFHRETSERHISQMGQIAEQVFSSLRWLEDYTAIEYPFAKYDLAIIPGFQFGGMEHTGATFYNASLMFLPENATLSQRLRRDMLIAHETAHMWFGDYVTMEWFSGVWVKEVFANYFAARMIRPHYPDIDFKLQDLSFNISAYEEDRTSGANSIQQDLPNLRYAGLIYGNIIYQKSPVVMEMLSEKMGEEAFRSAIREYLKKYAYSNAGWDDLVEIFDKHYSAQGENIEEWSEFWIYGKGMPVVRQTSEGFIGLEESRQQVVCDTLGGYVIPAYDGSFYGYIELEEGTINYILEDFYAIARNVSSRKGVSEELVRESLLIILYENWIRGNIPSDRFVNALLEWVVIEDNQQVIPTILSCISSICRAEGYGSAIGIDVQRALYSYLRDRTNQKFLNQVFRTLLPISYDNDIVNYLYKVWNKEVSLGEAVLSENDYIDLSLELALRLPDSYGAIVGEQLSRIANPDKFREYEFVSPAASPDASVRDSVFNSFSIPQNRITEPWVLKSLLLLHHPHWGDYPVKYIYPSLELLEELQRTGDIFFPKSWCKNTLLYHYSPKAKESVLQFLKDTPELLPLLENKILQSSYHLGSM